MAPFLLILKLGNSVSSIQRLKFYKITLFQELSYVPKTVLQGMFIMEIFL